MKKSSFVPVSLGRSLCLTGLIAFNMMLGAGSLVGQELIRSTGDQVEGDNDTIEATGSVECKSCFAGLARRVQSAATAQVLISGPEGCRFSSIEDVQRNLTVPGRINLRVGSSTRFAVSLVGERAGEELTVELTISPSSEQVKSFFAHSAIPVQLTDEDIECARAGKGVTKAVYMPNKEFALMTLAGVETLVSTRLDTGLDLVAEARRRGDILAVLEIGNRTVDVTGERAQGVGEKRGKFIAPVPKVTGVDGDYIEIWGGREHGFEIGENVYVYVGNSTKNGLRGMATIIVSDDGTCIAKGWENAKQFEVGDHVYRDVQHAEGRTLRSFLTSRRQQLLGQRQALMIDIVEIELAMVRIGDEEAGRSKVKQLEAAIREMMTAEVAPIDRQLEVINRHLQSTNSEAPSDSGTRPNLETRPNSETSANDAARTEEEVENKSLFEVEKNHKDKVKVLQELLDMRIREREAVN